MTGAANVREFTGKHMLAIMLAFFGVVLAANMTMVYFARSSWTGLVVKNSYVASQEFDEKTAEMQAAAALDVHPAIVYSAETLKVTLLTKAGVPVVAQNIKMALGRPSFEAEDHEVQLADKGQGVYEAAHPLAPGQWTGTLSADLAGHGQWSRPILITVK